MYKAQGCDNELYPDPLLPDASRHQLVNSRCCPEASFEHNNDDDTGNSFNNSQATIYFLGKEHFHCTIVLH